MSVIIFYAFCEISNKSVVSAIMNKFMKTQSFPGHRSLCNDFDWKRLSGECFRYCLLVGSSLQLMSHVENAILSNQIIETLI